MVKKRVHCPMVRRTDVLSGKGFPEKRGWLYGHRLGEGGDVLCLSYELRDVDFVAHLRRPTGRALRLAHRELDTCKTGRPIGKDPLDVITRGQHAIASPRIKGIELQPIATVFRLVCKPDQGVCGHDLQQRGRQVGIALVAYVEGEGVVPARAHRCRVCRARDQFRAQPRIDSQCAREYRLARVRPGDRKVIGRGRETRQVEGHLELGVVQHGHRVGLAHNCAAHHQACEEAGFEWHAGNSERRRSSVAGRAGIHIREVAADCRDPRLVSTAARVDVSAHNAQVVHSRPRSR